MKSGHEEVFVMHSENSNFKCRKEKEKEHWTTLILITAARDIKTELICSEWKRFFLYLLHALCTQAAPDCDVLRGWIVFKTEPRTSRLINNLPSFC